MNPQTRSVKWIGQLLSSKRGDEVPRPQPWTFIFGDLKASKNWANLCAVANSSADHAWVAITSDPLRTDQRQHRLKGTLSSGNFKGIALPQWQFEVTGAGRIWYLVDKENRLIIMTMASTGHPNATDNGKNRR